MSAEFWGSNEVPRSDSQEAWFIGLKTGTLTTLLISTNRCFTSNISSDALPYIRLV